MNSGRKLLTDCRGTMLLEFVFCFPLLFALFLFIVQFAYIMITWQVVNYAAYMGARSALTTNLIMRQKQAEDVVKRILAVVSNSPSNNGEAATDHAPDKYTLLDGWGRLPHTKYLDKQVQVTLRGLDQGHVQCTVKFKMFLPVPVAGPLISFWGKRDKGEAEKAYQEKLQQAQFALNPALLAQYANEIELEKAAKMPYLELVSHGAVFIPYSTLKYPGGLK